MLLVTSVSFAQPKKIVKVARLSVFETKLKATNLPYEKINDSTVVIPFKGTAIDSYQIIITKTENMYVLLNNLSNSIPNIENENNYKRLLELNNDLDIVKLSIEKVSGKIFARIDSYAVATNSDTLSKLIGQIADAVDYIAKAFK